MGSRKVIVAKRRKVRLDVTIFLVVGVALLGVGWAEEDAEGLRAVLGVWLGSLAIFGAAASWLVLESWFSKIGRRVAYTPVSEPDAADVRDGRVVALYKGGECTVLAGLPRPAKEGYMGTGQTDGARETMAGALAILHAGVPLTLRRSADGGWEARRRGYPERRAVGAYLGERGLRGGAEAWAEAAGEYGLNRLEIKVPSFGALLLDQLKAPFFVFQVFCIGVWMLDVYWFYSLVSLGLLVMFESTVALQRAVNLRAVQSMAVPERAVRVRRDGSWAEAGSYSLVPGDVVVVTEAVCPADVVLLAGSAVVNEAMLTGEATPVRKEALDAASADVELDPSGAHSRSVVRAGTEVLRADGDRESPLRPPGNAAVGFVLRTGHGTVQGKLLRTIVESTETASANTWEAFVFIAVLLVFALAAAAHVLREGLAAPPDVAPTGFQLLLHCIMIVTSAIPPELPLELSMAVNAALLALRRAGIFCTQPFRIPFAGRLDVCAFDKTGTLTENRLSLLGVARCAADPLDLTAGRDMPLRDAEAAAVCHSLVSVDNRQMGDPTEVAVLEGVGWEFRDGASARVAGGGRRLSAVRTFNFSADLRRMSVLAGPPSAPFVACKGAPEVMRALFNAVPPGYDAACEHYTRSGMRVLALGRRDLPPARAADLRSIPRTDAERDLDFCGLLVLHAALKPTAADAVAQLRMSSHLVVMLTGDNLRTAAYVARHVGIADSNLRTMNRASDGQWEWNGDGDGDQVGLTGDMLDALVQGARVGGEGLDDIMPRVRVWARTSPRQKADVMRLYGQRGRRTMMCGDGTNDVGALKAADVGLALLNRTDEKKEVKKKEVKKRGAALELEEDPTVVRLGDASVAAPFTARGESVMAAVDVVRQGRCTLVATNQMFVILALKSLLLAYSMSALHLQGARMSDLQLTLSSLLVSALFMLLSQAQPVEVLSPRRPLPSVISAGVLFNVVLQFAVHMAALLGVLHATGNLFNAGLARHDKEFEPSLLNNVVFLLGTAMGATDFAVNYRGEPFMQGLRSHRWMARVVFGTYVGLALLLLGALPDAESALGLAPMDSDLRYLLLSVSIGDLVAAFCIDRLCRFFFNA